MSVLSPIKSTAMIPYEHGPFIHRQVLKTHQAFLESSFLAQLADQRHLQPTTVRDRIVAGRYEAVQSGPKLPTPFPGTRKTLLRIIGKTVHETNDRLDYNGSLPYLKILSQLARGKSFDEVIIDSRNEEYGTTCIGAAHAILKDLKQKHGIDGMLAVQRKNLNEAFEHGAVIIECSDGFVLLDPRANPEIRILSVAFDSTRNYPWCSLTAAVAGSTTPLTIRYPDMQLEYCTNVGNGDDLVMKHFVMHAPFEEGHAFFPVATFNPDGSDRKFIGVNLKKSTLFLIDRSKPKGSGINVPFHQIRQNPEAFHKTLSEFMDPNASFPGFHIPTELAYRQLCLLVSQEERVQRLFVESHPRAIT